MQFKFAEVLPAQGHQACVVGPWRQLREDHLAGGDKELHAKNAGSAQGIGHLTGHALGFQQLTLLQFGGLPAALVVAPFLDVANRRAEQGWTVLLAHRQQGDLLLEPQKFLHDHQAGAAARTFGGGGPGLLQFLGVGGHALAFAGGAHHGLHHHRPAQRLGCAAELFR